MKASLKNEINKYYTKLKISLKNFMYNDLINFHNYITLNYPMYFDIIRERKQNELLNDIIVDFIIDSNIDYLNSEGIEKGKFKFSKSNVKYLNVLHYLIISETPEENIKKILSLI